jgi:hypothetical protein
MNNVRRNNQRRRNKSSLRKRPRRRKKLNRPKRRWSRCARRNKINNNNIRKRNKNRNVIKKLIRIRYLSRSRNNLSRSLKTIKNRKGRILRPIKL